METYQLMILSSDEVFSRMLELEFSMQGLQVAVRRDGEGGDWTSDTVLLDLDSAAPPPESCYRNLIGFTTGGLLAPDEARRRCSMILHRPFELRLLRREILQRDEGLMMTPLRKAPAPPPSNPTSRDAVLSDTEQVLILDGERIPLTPKEHAVMRCLLANRGSVVDRAAIADAIGESLANKVDVYVCFLRRKTESPGKPRLLFTVRGAGYIIY